MILYACGSDLIVDYLEVCQKNNVTVETIVNNLEPLTIEISGSFLVPLFSPFNRYRAVKEALELGLVPFPLLSDRNNDLPIVFEHGVGCFINKSVVIGSHGKLGNYVVINRGACLGHHIKLDDFVSIGPGVTTGGGVTIRRGAMIGTGAVILPDIEVGTFAVVGAGAVVTENVSTHAMVIGNPSKQIKSTEYEF
jgi:UDP-3-O-[3-hydroxymyristoyl] glucosamine N-acyltransferase